jgi:hypothetical protein
MPPPLCACVLQIDDDRRVTSFAEKPKGAALDDMQVGCRQSNGARHSWISCRLLQLNSSSI